MKENIFRKRVGRGERVPKGFGMCYYEGNTPNLICYPIPFNYIISFVRWLYLNIRNPYFFRAADAFELGRKKGREEAIKEYYAPPQHVNRRCTITPKEEEK